MWVLNVGSAECETMEINLPVCKLSGQPHTRTSLLLVVAATLAPRFNSRQSQDMNLLCHRRQKKFFRPFSRIEWMSTGRGYLPVFLILDLGEGVPAIFVVRNQSLKLRCCVP